MLLSYSSLITNDFILMLFDYLILSPTLLVYVWRRCKLVFFSKPAPYWTLLRTGRSLMVALERRGIVAVVRLFSIISPSSTWSSLVWRWEILSSSSIHSSLAFMQSQDEERDSLVESLQSQITMMLSEWQNARTQRDAGKDTTFLSQSGRNEALRLRLSLVCVLVLCVVYESYPPCDTGWRDVWCSAEQQSMDKWYCDLADKTSSLWDGRCPGELPPC